MTHLLARSRRSDTLALAAGLLVGLPAISLAQAPAAPAAAAKAEASSPALTPAETAAGWKLLFDGTTFAGWHGYKKKSLPGTGWTIENGCMKCIAKGGGGDLATNEQYGDFELTFEWKVSPGANSGVMYRVSEDKDASWQTGPEFQIIDDGGYPTPLKPAQSTGAIYDLVEPAAAKKLLPAGEFNRGRIRLKDGILTHFVNDVKVAEADLAGDEWKRLVAASKFAPVKEFGAMPRGSIVLQDHGNDVWFRNIRVRDLSAEMPGEVKLFNGKNLDGWAAFLNDNGKMENVWTIDDGVMVCKGNPIGYIHTQKDYKNFVLKLEWRFNPVTKKAGNSGVLLRTQAPDKVWPKSVEAQLQHENAGDFWNIEEFPMQTVKERLKGRNTRKTHMAERPLGQWNEYEIVVAGDKVTLNVNGETLNQAWDVQEVAGKICLQSEGAEIHFRNIRLAEIK